MIEIVSYTSGQTTERLHFLSLLKSFCCGTVAHNFGLEISVCLVDLQCLSCSTIPAEVVLRNHFSKFQLATHNDTAKMTAVMPATMYNLLPSMKKCADRGRIAGTMNPAIDGKCAA